VTQGQIINCNAPSDWNSNPPVLSGTSSWFNAVAQGGGACGYTPSDSDRNVAAYSAPTVEEMCLNCGSCFNVTGPKGSAVVRIIDYCDTTQGSCATGFFTLDQVPYTVIAGSTGTGSVPVTYSAASCPETGNLEYTYGDGGDQKYYVAVRVDWHRYPLESFEIRSSGGSSGPWASLPRASDNVWWYNPTGAGQVMPAEVRVNDTAGQSITDTLPSFSFSSYTSSAQFPLLGGATSGVSTSYNPTTGSASTTKAFSFSTMILSFFSLFLLTL